MMMSCGLREIGAELPQKNEGVWKGPGANMKPGGTGSMKRSVWYVTGFDYPDGYDWMSDPEAGSVKCSLVVYANAVPMLKIPVGKEYEVSADSDMHRMIDGDLYTDFSTDSMTVIKKNGRHLFSYLGREMIVGMHVDSSGVYTLGQSRNGSGFSFRKDGEILMQQLSGSIVGELSFSEHGYAFAFSENVIGAAQSSSQRYYLCRNGVVSQIAVRDDIKKVWDVAVSDGEVYYIAMLTGIAKPVLVSEDAMYMLDPPSRLQAKSCRFIYSGSDILIECVFANSAGIMTSGLWRKDSRECLFPAGMTLWASYVDDSSVSCVLSHNSKDELKISRCGEIMSLPEGYTVMGTTPLAMVDGILHVGMTSLEGAQPAVWMDGEVKELGFNGYISSISVWKP